MNKKQIENGNTMTTTKKGPHSHNNCEGDRNENWKLPETTSYRTASYLWGNEKDSESQVITNAYFARADKETVCPYQMNTVNFHLWMHCRFGKLSDQEINTTRLKK